MPKPFETQGELKPRPPKEEILSQASESQAMLIFMLC